MPESIFKDLEKGWQLLNEGEVENALQSIQKIENRKDLEPLEILKSNVLKSLLYFFLGRFKEAIELAKQTYKESKKLGKPLLSIDSNFTEWLSQLHNSTRSYELRINLIKDTETLLGSATENSQVETEKSELLLSYMKGVELMMNGDLNEALKSIKRSHSLCEQFTHLTFLIPRILYMQGAIYHAKGELKKGQELLEKSMELNKGESFGFKLIFENSLEAIGGIYYWQGNLDLAINEYKKLLENKNYLAGYRLAPRIYTNLIKVLIDKGSNEQGWKYLRDFHQFVENERDQDEYSHALLELSRARLLKSSSRIRDRAESERILKELLLNFPNSTRGFFYIIQGLVEICDFYINELHSTNDLEVINDLQPYITRLNHESERANSYSYLAQTYLLQGNLELLKMNIGDAQMHLTKAQTIAEDHGLQLLARAISVEHDKLMVQLNKLNKTKDSEITISERLSLASLGEIMDHLQRKRTLTPPDLIEEEPILLVIIGNDGISYFTHLFKNDWDFNELFSNFLSAFNTFSAEIFSKSIDRIKIDENVILVKPVESFMICYVIKGQSYPALQKLNRFSDAIKWNTEISEALRKSVETGEELNLNNPPSLGIVMNEIFNQ